MDATAKIMRQLEELRRDVALVRRVLVRFGTVHSVDVDACTVIVEWSGDDASGAKAKSLPVPWLQRSTEHRPPAVGDHAVVFDPSLGNGAAVALIGWPSTARPAPDTAGQKHVLYAGDDPCKILSPTVELGQAPDDMAALASIVDDEIARVWDVLTDSSIIPAPVAGPDAGETGLALLKSLANGAKTARASVAAAQVKIK